MRLILDLFEMKPIWTSDYGYVWCFCAASDAATNAAASDADAAAADAAIFIKYGQDFFVPFQQKSCRWWELGNKAFSFGQNFCYEPMNFCLTSKWS